MADVFERRADLNAERDRLWKLIDDTPNLDWLLLTKRPQNIARIAPWGDDWPTNVWLGTSVENQTLAEKRLPFLLKTPATVRFLSCEPLLGQLNLDTWFKRNGFYPIDWVIAGGESGGASRPMHPDWVSSLLHQCQSFEVPFHFKQWGQWVPVQLVQGTARARMVELQERYVSRLREKTVDTLLAHRGQTLSFDELYGEVMMFPLVAESDLHNILLSLYPGVQVKLAGIKRKKPKLFKGDQVVVQSRFK